LAPKLDRLINSNQNLFIPGRSLHNNFVLVKQFARLQHLVARRAFLFKLDLARLRHDALGVPV
jgi:hypothetical protein